MIRRDIDGALLDHKLLGAALGPPDTWRTWLTVLRATFGLPLLGEDRKRFAEIAGDRSPPPHRVSELWALAGRGSGKSRMAGATCAFISTFEDHRRRLAPGETGCVLCVSPTVGQSRLVFSYALAFLQRSKILAQKIVSTTASEIRLDGNIVIATHPASFRSVRGRTLLACVFDECALWRSEESAQPDLEIYRAVLPSLARSRGLLVAISTPYRRSGLLYAKHRAHFGKSSDDVLCVKGPTSTFNPTIDLRVVERSRQLDPQGAVSEWDAEFRADINQLFDDAVIDQAIDRSRPMELPPQAGITYFAFTDASAGRHDSYTLCIGHREGNGDKARFVADVIRGRKAPFPDPRAVTREYVELAKQYGVHRIMGDRYSSEWVASAHRDFGATYDPAPLAKSDIYLEFQPYMNRGAISIPPHVATERELRLLERTARAGGSETVDIPRGISDDHANAVAGCAYLALKQLSAEDHVRRIGAQADLLGRLCAERAGSGAPPVVWSWATYARERRHGPGLAGRWNGPL
jgi:hypothetical protein